MKLIIAEKPNLAKNIRHAIGDDKFKKFNGYYESNEYIVTHAFGHLFGLVDIEAYKPKDVREEKPKWTLEGLPFRPEEFKFDFRINPKTRSIDSGCRQQFNVIKTLCERKDVDAIVNAGDADREGEIIVRIILAQAKNTKPVYRLWSPDQTPEAIRQDLRHMKLDTEYDRLAAEGYARTYIDWLYGVNLTRLASIKSGTLLRVGRVIVPIVKAIYDRDMAIRNFVPQKYLVLSSTAETNGEEITLVSKHRYEMSSLEEAQSQCETYNLAGATVKDIKVEEVSKQAGHLYSLSKLQGVLGKKFKMSPDESLSTVQKLYEAGYVTYPRTNTEYLATTECGKINTILDKLKAQGYKVCRKDTKRSIFDDSKIESHSALTPTLKLAKKEDLSKKEWQVYSTIFNRFLAVFCSEDCKVNRTTITIEINRSLETFVLKGEVLLSKGWMQYDDPGRKDKFLPKLYKGDAVNIDFKPTERETTPPKHYTIDSLLNYLKNPFRKEKLGGEEEEESSGAAEVSSAAQNEAEAEEYKAMFEGVEIGTEATRTAIIKNAIDSHYIELKKDTYTILPGGEFLILALRKLNIHMEKEKTADLGRALKRVYRGELTIDASVTMAYQEVKTCFTASTGVKFDPSDLPKGLGPQIIGKCPKCGENVVERQKVFGCSNKECGFALWKDNKLLSSIGFKLSPKLAKAILTSNRILLKGCVSAKSGKTFNCYLIPKLSGEQAEFDIEMATADDLSLGNCPKCGKPVVERPTLYGCSNKDCKFAIWKEDKFFAGIGKKPTPAVVKALLNKGQVSLKNCTSKKTGKKYDCIVVVDFSGQYPQYNMKFPPKKGPRK